MCSHVCLARCLLWKWHSPGVLLQEINHAGAGGLWAELVSNRGITKFSWLNSNHSEMLACHIFCVWLLIRSNMILLEEALLYLIKFICLKVFILDNKYIVLESGGDSPVPYIDWLVFVKFYYVDQKPGCFSVMHFPVNILRNPNIDDQSLSWSTLFADTS